MFEHYQTQNELKIRMSATLENIDLADDELATYLESQEVHVDCFGTRILLREGLLNAVEHGSNTDEKLTVHLELAIEETGILLRIVDPGNGFDWQKQRENDPDDLSENGRGLALMQLYSDKMSYNNKGNELTLNKLFKVDEVVKS